MKDLRVLKSKDRRLENMVLVDNCGASFGFQPDNAVPILEFINDKGDYELHALTSFLKSLEHRDMQTALRETFHLSKFGKCKTDRTKIIKKIEKLYSK